MNELMRWFLPVSRGDSIGIEGGTNPFKKFLNVYKKLSSFNTLSAYSMTWSVAKLTSLAWKLDKFFKSLIAFLIATIPHYDEHSILAYSALGEFLYAARYRK